MKNKAKCKLCNEIIESFHKTDIVSCKCGEITIEGGTQSYLAYAKNFANFLRIDDEEKEIPVKFIGKDEVVEVVSAPQKTSKTDLLDSLKHLIETYERLPEQVLRSPASQYDLYSVLLLVDELFRS